MSALNLEISTKKDFTESMPIHIEDQKPALGKGVSLFTEDGI